jgi:hypothetical protein
MTDEQLQAIRQRWMDSTPGEWITTADVDIDGETPYWDRVISVAVSDEYAETALSEIVQLPECEDQSADLIFIAAAHQDVPALLEEIDRLQAQAGRSLPPKIGNARPEGSRSCRSILL